MQPAQVVQLQDAQFSDAVAVLGRAFHDDPFMQYVYPDEAHRARMAAYFWGGVVRLGRLYGEVHTTDAVEATAVWMAPHYPRIGFWAILRARWLAMPRRSGWAAYKRLRQYGTQVEAVKTHHMPLPHWYLWSIGVTPEKQGQGIAGALLRPMMARADTEGTPCYLEASKATNVPIYQRYGFEVIDEVQVGAHGPRFWPMARYPSRD